MKVLLLTTITDVALATAVGDSSVEENTGAEVIAANVSAAAAQISGKNLIGHFIRSPPLEVSRRASRRDNGLFW
jgi:hypothetical protein